MIQSQTFLASVIVMAAGLNLSACESEPSQSRFQASVSEEIDAIVLDTGRGYYDSRSSRLEIRLDDKTFTFDGEKGQEGECKISASLPIDGEARLIEALQRTEICSANKNCFTISDAENRSLVLTSSDEVLEEYTVFPISRCTYRWLCGGLEAEFFIELRSLLNEAFPTVNDVCREIIDHATGVY